MDAKDHHVIAVLGDQKRFVVPLYQRRYRWREERLAPFWADVVGKAEEVLEGGPKFSHYMGALILAPGADGYTIGATPRVQVVDGQQRLTTFQLFLAAVRDVGTSLGFPEIGEAVRNYLFNRPMSGDKDEDATFKLVPTPEDKAVFRLAVGDGLPALREKHPGWFFQNGKPIKSKIPKPTLTPCWRWPISRSESKLMPGSACGTRKIRMGLLPRRVQQTDGNASKRCWRPYSVISNLW